MPICECPKVAPGPYKPRPDKTLSKGWKSGLRPQVYVEKPLNASVPLNINYRRWRVGEDTKMKKVQHSNEYEPKCLDEATSRVPRSLKDERRKIKKNQQEFYKAYKERFGRQTPLSRITPNPLKINTPYNVAQTASKRQIPYEPADKRRIRQQQIDFIREYERKTREERLSFEDIEQQNRIRQQQLDFIKEFDRKLEENLYLEQDAIDAAYEENLRRKQLEFMQKYEEEEAAKRAASLRSTATYAGTTSYPRGVGYNKLTGPKFFREKPGLLSVKYHRWRAGEDHTASNDSITHHIHNTPYVIVTPVPRSPQEEEEEIRQQLQEFVKAADQKFGNQSTTIDPKHKKSRLSYQKTKEAEQAALETQQEQDRIKQKQLNFIREFEHKLKEEEQKAAKHKIIPKHPKSRLSYQKTKKAELAAFKNQQQQDRIKQKQLNCTREFEHKLKKEEEQKAAKHKIIPKHTNSRLSYQKTKKEELAAFKNQQQQDRIKQKQLNFIKKFEHKLKEDEEQKAAKHKIILKHTKSRRSYQKTKKVELSAFKTQQEQDRIKQKQLNFISEFEHKVKEDEERKAAEARKYEKRIWQQQVKFIKEFKAKEEKEERERARRERIEEKRASRQRKTKARVMRAKKNRREEEMAKKNKREEKMAKKTRREEEMAKKKRRVKKKATKRPIRIESEADFGGETSHGYYDRARAKERLREKQAEQREKMADWFYRCCCKVYCCTTTVVLIVAVIVIVVI